MRNIEKIVFLLIFIFCSCNKNYYFNRDYEKIKLEINEINKSDQDSRYEFVKLYKKYNFRTFETIIDSIDQLGLSTINGVNFNDIKPIKIQLERLNKDKKNQFLIDEKNTKLNLKSTDSVNRIKIIKLIEKYGFPDFESRRIDRNEEVVTGIVTPITHFNYNNKNDSKYFFKLLLKEYKKNRLSESSFKHILWDINGRKGIIDSVQTIDLIKKIKNDFDL